jgi:hypothetical protein
MYEYENVKRIQYEGGATFIPVCTICCRFVKPRDYVLTMGEDGPLVDVEPTADCSKCGPCQMIFEGFV